MAVDVLEAAIDALWGEEASSDSGYYGTSHRIDMDHASKLAAEVLAVVRPMIQAETSEFIAEEIKKRMDIARAEANRYTELLTPESANFWEYAASAYEVAYRIAKRGMNAA